MSLEAIYLDTDGAMLTGGSTAEVEAFTQYFNAMVLPNATAVLGCTDNRLAVEFQERFSRVVFPMGADSKPAAKKYCARYEIYQSKPVISEIPVVEIKGLEVRRGDTSRLARRMQQETIDCLMDGCENISKFEELVIKWRTHILTGEINIEDVQISKGVKESYKFRARKDGTPILPPQAHIANKLRARGQRPFKVSYYVVDGSTSPMTIAPAEDYAGDIDRYYLWENVYPPTLRLLAGAFDKVNWNRWKAKRPKKPLAGQMSLFNCIDPKHEGI